MVNIHSALTVNSSNISVLHHFKIQFTSETSWVLGHLGHDELRAVLELEPLDDGLDDLVCSKDAHLEYSRGSYIFSANLDL